MDVCPVKFRYFAGQDNNNTVRRNSGTPRIAPNEEKRKVRKPCYRGFPPESSAQPGAQGDAGLRCGLFPRVPSARAP